MSLSNESIAERQRRDLRRGEAFALGGNRTPIVFTATQHTVLAALVDELVPAGDGFPAPSEVGVIDEFFTRYVEGNDVPILHFPYARESEFKARLDALAPEVTDSDSATRVAMLSRLELEEPEFFGQLRALTYAGYYSRAVVVRAIRTNLEAGRDYRGRPQPYGYADTTEDWPEGELKGGNGTYIRTDDVTRVE